MPEAKYTPGPWVVDDTGAIIGEGMALASVHGAEDFPCLPEEDYDECNVQCAANARLMAAAPDLLAACIAMRRTMYSPKSEESIAADAAIAKALGT
jgi:hypothetical protein